MCSLMTYFTMHYIVNFEDVASCEREHNYSLICINEEVADHERVVVIDYYKVDVIG
jgi:hypothetical protein